MWSKTCEDSRDDICKSESIEGDKKMAAKKTVVTKEVEEMMEMQDEITVDLANSQTEWEHVLSMVPMPRTLLQHIWDISQHWTRDKNIAQEVVTIQNWMAVLKAG
jgi:hypothetical protein